MAHRPLSFTKNLGGLEHLYDAIRRAYRPGTTLREFEARLPRSLANRRLVIIQFFIATRLVGRTEYVVENALVHIRTAYPFVSRTHHSLFVYRFKMIVKKAGLTCGTQPETQCQRNASVRRLS